MLSVITNANIYTPVGNKAVKGNAMRCLRHILDGEIHSVDGLITYVGSSESAPKIVPDYVIDANGCVVLPGFVDSHTHMVFGGYRQDEFMWRMRGDSYMSIMNRGGGIVNTMSATRSASSDELSAKTIKFLDTMSHMGVTTVEGKSGYGLDHDAEIKQLKVMKHINAMPDKKVDIVSTYLGGHALPPEYANRHDEYIEFMINEMLPEIKKEQLADYCDIFCEEGVFDIAQSRRLLSKAKEMGFGVKIHADEIENTGGAQLAASLGALSADHLLHISDEGVDALAESDTVATLLPLTAFTLREPYAPARKLIDRGCAVALATDLNPGSCFSGSIPLMIALACIYMDMSVEETVTALTLNGAAALGIADRVGSIEVGKKADMVILDSDNINILPYYTAMNCVAATIKNGIRISSNI